MTNKIKNPYLRLMRLHQPTGIWLLLWPCWWSIALASDHILADLDLLALFAIGAITMRGAGCTINDIIDRKIDAQVTRTKTRPLASGELTVLQALVFLAFLLTIGLIILLSLNTLTILLGVVALLPIAAYPFMKRVTRWPQLFLALTFNWGAFMGWTATVGAIDPTTFVLYGVCMCWTLGYDTIYAHQDKKDDARIGVQSTALTLGDNTKIFISVCYLLMIVGFAWAGLANKLHLLYYVGLLFAGAHLFWQVSKVDLDNPLLCMAAFCSNMQFGWIIFVSILLGKMV